MWIFSSFLLKKNGKASTAFPNTCCWKKSTASCWKNMNFWVHMVCLAAPNLSRSFFVWPEWSYMKKTLVRFYHVNFLRTWEFFWVAGVELHEKNSCEVFSCKFSPYLVVFSCLFVFFSFFGFLQFHWNPEISIKLLIQDFSRLFVFFPFWIVSVSLKSRDFNEAADPSFLVVFIFFRTSKNIRNMEMAGPWENFLISWLANAFWGMVGVSATGAWLEHPDWWWPSLPHVAFGSNKHEPSFQASVQKWSLAECGGGRWNWQSRFDCLEGIWTLSTGLSWHGAAKICAVPKVPYVDAYFLLSCLEICQVCLHRVPYDGQLPVLWRLHW